MNFTKKQTALGAICAVVLVSFVSQCSLWKKYNAIDKAYTAQVDINQQLMQILENSGAADEAAQNSQSRGRGTWEEVPEEIAQKIEGSSVMDDSPITASDLAYLTLPYCDFDGQVSTGHMLCSKAIADEVLDIFEELFFNTYPIHSIEIAEDFADKQTAVLTTLEAASKGSNNTTCLMYKKNGDELDKSAYGMAIDINPLLNPDTTGTDTMPRNAIRYKDRENAELTYTENWAFIKPDADIIKTFEKYGWKWCGEDGNYGRFEKE